MSTRLPGDPLHQSESRPFDPSRPFRRSAAAANGITKRQLDGPKFTRIVRGVYVASHVAITQDVRIAAVAEAAGYGVFSHLTAAHLLGAPTPRHNEIHLMVHHDKRRTIEGAHIHRRQRAPNWKYARGFAVTDPVDTMRDLAMMQFLDFDDLVIAGDGLVRAGHLSAEELQDRLCHPAHPWDRTVARAVRAAESVRDGVDSAMETRTRLILVRGGCPEPVVNFPIRDASGRVVRRIDLAYPDLKIAIEYDGRHHIERKEQWHRDVLRREELEAHGWVFLVITAPDLYKPEELVERVRKVRAARSR